MARTPHPWWWEAEGGWYVNSKGRRRPLGKHPEGAPPPRKSEKTGLWNAPEAIKQAFRRLMDAPEAVEAVTAPPPAEDRHSVVAVLKAFIAWCKENRERLTAKRYKEFLEDFVNADTPEGVQIGLMPATSLTSLHVTEWLQTKRTWGPTTKKNAITALQAGFNWAVQNRGLQRNPIKGMKKPEAKRRSDVISTTEFEELLGLVGGGPFAELLTVSYDCGARPIEVKELERRHVEPEKRRAVIPADEAKGRRHPRTIYFPTDRSWETVERLCRERPTGAIFLNTKGNKWTGLAVKCRFEDIEVAFGLEEMERLGIPLDTSEESIVAVMATLSRTRKSKAGGETVKKNWEVRKEARQKLVARQAKQHGKRFNHYAFRRTFITRKIIAGVDSHVVARLSGHQSTAMIDRHYSVVAADHEFMLREAMRDVKPKE